MNAKQRQQIKDNSYSDLIIHYHGDMNVFKKYPSGTINLLNTDFAILHVPSNLFTSNSISKFGYTSIPCLYSLQSSIPKIKEYVSEDIPDYTQNHKSFTGKDVLVGIIDTGIDYLSPLFLDNAGNTRIEVLWDQEVELNKPTETTFHYGTLFTEDEINLALNSNDPNVIVPSLDSTGHGTMIAAIACGSKQKELTYSGVAPDSKLAVVKLKPAKENLKEFRCVPKSSLAFQENDIMTAIVFLVEYAKSRELPISIVLGVGTSQGDHSGRGYLSTLINTYSALPGVTITVPAGNESNRNHHYHAHLPSSSNGMNLCFHVAPEEDAFLVEVYNAPPSNFTLNLVTPSNEIILTLEPSISENSTTKIYHFDTTVIVNAFSKEDYVSLEQTLIIRLFHPIPGMWQFVLRPDSGLDLDFHIWFPVKSFLKGNTYLCNGTNDVTITAPGNAEHAITVSAYNQKTDTLYLHASMGNTVINNSKPDISAPGVDITVPIDPYYGYVAQGTSLASAYVGGVSALLYQWDKDMEYTVNFSGLQMKKALTYGALRSPDMEYPNTSWGYGMVDVNKTLALLEKELPKYPIKV